MRHPFRLLVLLLAAVHGASVHGAASVQVELERAVRATPLRGAAVGISIRDSDSQSVIGRLNADTPLMPASNMKLLTTGAALHVFGAEFKFDTRLLHDDDRLIIVGSGDPAFGDPALLELMDANDGRGIGVDDFLNLWVQPVVDAGLSQVRELIVDDRVFDRTFVHDTWPVDQLNRRYCAEVAGVNFHANVLHFFPRPASDGRRPNITNFKPHASWLDIGNSATSRTERDDPNSVWISRKRDTNTLRFYGNVKHAYRVPVPVTVHDMPMFFGRLLADRLRESGVKVDSVRLAIPDEPEFTGDTIAPVITTPISTIIERCNRDSQNLYAEALLKRLGGELTQQPGSWVNGSAMVRHAAHERLDSTTLAASIIVADGSGLSRDNRIAPETLTAWLETFHEEDAVGRILIDSLAQPGGKGTLRNRFRGMDLHGMVVRAKSGYINGVSCLSGYVTAPDGRRRSFSILCNEVPDQLTLRRARRLQEEIVGIIAADLAAATMEVRMGSD